MTNQPKVNFLEEGEGIVSEIKLSLLVELVRMIDRNNLRDALDELVATTDPNILLPIKTANEVKQFVIDNGLHEKERLAKIVLLSAHCPCRGKTFV